LQLGWLPGERRPCLPPRLQGRETGSEDERQRIVKRANAGRKAARERGARFGRKPKLSAETAGGRQVSLGRIYRVSHTTVARLRASG